MTTRSADNQDEPDYKYILFDSPKAIQKQEKARAHIYDKDRSVPKYERDAKKFTPPKFRRGDVLVLFATLSSVYNIRFEHEEMASAGCINSNSDNDRRPDKAYVAISNLKVASVSDPSTTLGEYLYTMETTGDSVGEAFLVEGSGEDRIWPDMEGSDTLPDSPSDPSGAKWSNVCLKFVFRRSCTIVLHHEEIINTSDYLAIRKNSRGVV